MILAEHDVWIVLDLLGRLFGRVTFSDVFGSHGNLVQDLRLEHAARLLLAQVQR